jgi:hypothetical protein
MADFFTKHLPFWLLAKNLKKRSFGARSLDQFWDFLIPIYSPDPVLRLLLDKSTCQGEEHRICRINKDQKIPELAKNDLRTALQNFVFL